MKFDGESGHIKTITNIASSVSSDVNQQLYWYCGSTGDKQDNQVESFFKIFDHYYFLEFRCICVSS